MDKLLMIKIANRLEDENLHHHVDLFIKAITTPFNVRTASNGIDKELISSKHMKDGFEIRKEKWSMPWDNTQPVEMESVYNQHGKYIGDVKTAKMLIEKGILPEPANEKNNVCSIGYSIKDGKWYGWSHRAIHGFGIGDNAVTFSPYKTTTSKEKIKTLEEAKQAAIDFADSVD